MTLSIEISLSNSLSALKNDDSHSFDGCRWIPKTSNHLAIYYVKIVLIFLFCVRAHRCWWIKQNELLNKGSKWWSNSLCALPYERASTASAALICSNRIEAQPISISEIYENAEIRFIDSVNIASIIRTVRWVGRDHSCTRADIFHRQRRRRREKKNRRVLTPSIFIESVVCVCVVCCER